MYKEKDSDLISVCCANVVSSSKKQSMCQEGCSIIREMGTIAINKAIGKAQHEEGVPFPTPVFQKVE